MQSHPTRSFPLRVAQGESSTITASESGESRPAEAAPTQKTAVLVHGLGAHPFMMWLLGQRLTGLGYRVTNWGYPSILRTIERHGSNLAKHLAKLDHDASVGELYLVGHSMGCIVSRTALQHGRIAKLRRMVMLAPPNRGSRVATFFGPWLRPICSTIDQLASRPDSYVNRLPMPHDLEIGIIAAQYDGLVHLDSTYLGMERDHLVWPNALHSGVLFTTGVAEQISHFFQQGLFARTQAPLARSA